MFKEHLYFFLRIFFVSLIYFVFVRNVNINLYFKICFFFVCIEIKYHWILLELFLFIKKEEVSLWNEFYTIRTTNNFRLLKINKRGSQNKQSSRNSRMDLEKLWKLTNSHSKLTRIQFHCLIFHIIVTIHDEYHNTELEFLAGNKNLLSNLVVLNLMNRMTDFVELKIEYKLDSEKNILINSEENTYRNRLAYWEQL